MWIRQITPEGVAKRGHVYKLAVTDPYTALIIARSISHPWYKCQSLSIVAKYIKDQKIQLIVLNEAFEIAQTQEEINRIVTVSAWPLEILASIDLKAAKKRLNPLILQAKKEPHPIRRTDAIFGLFLAVKEFSSLLEIVIPPLVKTILSGHGWKIDRQIRFLITLFIKEKIFQEMIDSLIAHHRENREKRRFMASLSKIDA